MLYWHFTRIATAICEEHVCNKPGGREVLPCKHRSSQSCLCSSGGTGGFHSQVCHRYGKQAAHASQLKSCRLKRARPAAAATVKMLFGNHLLRELYKESKIPGRDAGLVLLHFLEVTNTKKKLLSQNKAFLPLQRHTSRQGRLALYSWPSNLLLTVVSKDLFSSGLSKKKHNTQPVWMESYAKALLLFSCQAESSLLISSGLYEEGHLRFKLCIQRAHVAAEHGTHTSTFHLR